MPPESRFDFLRDHAHQNVGDYLNRALGGLESENAALDGVLAHIDITRKVGQGKITDLKLRQLIAHFAEIRLQNGDFEFPDLLGAACEYLIGEFADSAGKKGGEFYTPRSVVRMMVRLVKPELGQDICDPCCGSGGMPDSAASPGDGPRPRPPGSGPGLPGPRHHTMTRVEEAGSPGCSVPSTRSSGIGVHRPQRFLPVAFHGKFP